MNMRRTAVVFVAAATCFAAALAFASEPIVYPAKGQSESKMEKDKSECRSWAIKQTGIDPSAPPPAAPAQQESSPKGGRVKGGARGAAGGAIVGAITGDAGKGAAIGAAAGGMRGGMEQRKEKKEAQADAQKAQAQAGQQRTDTFNRAYSACLEGRGYTVK